MIIFFCSNTLDAGRVGGLSLYICIHLSIDSFRPTCMHSYLSQSVRVHLEKHCPHIVVCLQGACGRCNRTANPSITCVLIPFMIFAHVIWMLPTDCFMRVWRVWRFDPRPLCFYSHVHPHICLYVLIYTYNMYIYVYMYLSAVMLCQYVCVHPIYHCPHIVACLQGACGRCNFTANPSKSCFLFMALLTYSRCCPHIALCVHGACGGATRRLDVSFACTPTHI